MVIWTVGHSTRSVDEFVAVLRAQGIEVLVDVRRFPASHRLPWFNAEPLRTSLAEADIAYHWLEVLGGRRAPAADSVNSGWRHRSFRGYADHMQTEEFAEGLFELLMLAGGMRTTVMCAELLWWRCHRRLIADQLTACGVDVCHIMDANHATAHRLIPPARVVRGHLSYR